MQENHRLTAVDPQLGKEVPLFIPRQDNWREHFIGSKDGQLIVGLTATGRATVMALAFNREQVVAIRAADLEIGRHPPADDPIQG